MLTCVCMSHECVHIHDLRSWHGAKGLAQQECQHFQSTGPTSQRCRVQKRQGEAVPDVYGIMSLVFDCSPSLHAFLCLECDAEKSLYPQDEWVYSLLSILHDFDYILGCSRSGCLRVRRHQRASMNTCHTQPHAYARTYMQTHLQVVVVGNPANTNAWVLQQTAPNIPKENFTALTRLDCNRAQSQIAMKVNVKPSAVEGD